MAFVALILFAAAAVFFTETHALHILTSSRYRLIAAELFAGLLGIGRLQYERVVITGMGWITPMGHSIEEVVEAPAQRRIGHRADNAV